MPEYEFPAGDSLEEHVPGDEEVVGVTYKGDTELVETEEQSNDYHRSKCEREDCDAGPFGSSQEYAGHMSSHTED